MATYSLTHLSDGTLLRGLAALVARDRANTAQLLAHIAEVDARRLYAPAGFLSMYAYCVGEFGNLLKRQRSSASTRPGPRVASAISSTRWRLAACT